MKRLVEALAEQAANALRDGDRFQAREDIFDGQEDWQRFLILLTEDIGLPVRASRNYGSITFYLDDGYSDGASITVARLEK
jgi:hypothetical protein